MTTLDLDAISAEFLTQCGSCDAGLPMGCSCSKRDYRPAMLALVREVQRLRARRGYASQRLEKAREAAENLLRQEQNNAGAGRDGRLNKADLVPLFEALGAIYLDDPNMQILVDPDGDPE